MSRQARLYATQLWEMTLCEWKLREQSTMVGFLWTLLQPLLMFGVLSLVFTRWMGGRFPQYAGFLLIGVVQWGFFNMATTYGLSSLNRRAQLLLNFRLPREIVVLSAVLSVALSYLLECGLMLAVVAALGAKPAASWLLLPLLAAAQLALVAGLALSLSVCAARWPDVERIWGVLMTAGFFLTPIFYTLDVVGPERRAWLWLNPMTHFIELTRACVLGGRAPSALHLAGLGGAAALAAAAGYAHFKRAEARLADYVGF